MLLLNKPIVSHFKWTLKCQDRRRPCFYLGLAAKYPSGTTRIRESIRRVTLVSRSVLWAAVFGPAQRRGATKGTKSWCGSKCECSSARQSSERVETTGDWNSHIEEGTETDDWERKRRVVADLELIAEPQAFFTCSCTRFVPVRVGLRGKPHESRSALTSRFRVMIGLVRVAARELRPGDWRGRARRQIMENSKTSNSCSELREDR